MTQGKVILVVGAGSGIGRATALKLLHEKFTVVTSDSREDLLTDLKREFPAVETLPLDITRAESRNAAFTWLKNKFQKINQLIITAGKHGTSPIEFLSDDEIDSILNVNLTGHIKLVRDLLPLVSDGGKIIGVSSLAGFIAVPMSSIYSASKFGLEGFYETLSLEASYRNIRAVLVQPGNVNSGFNEQGNDYHARGIPFLDEGYRRVVEKIHSRFGMDPARIADTILKAVKAKSPRFEYVPGWNAKKARYARILLGRRLSKFLIAKHFGF